MNELKVTSEMAELDKIRCFLKENLEGLNISEKEYYKIEVSLLEICINIIRYAYPREKGEIFLKAWLEEGKIFLEIRDMGNPFDPREIQKPDMKEFLKNEKRVGLGIFLSRKFMDGFDYKRENNQNVLTMYKKVKKTKESV